MTSQRSWGFAAWLGRVVLPAAAGIAVGVSIFREREAEPVAAPDSGRTAREVRSVSGPDRELPGDTPEAAYLAIFGGRTREAKQHLEEMLATGADDREIGRWLAALLTQEPGYLEVFLEQAPAERRGRLLCETLVQMSGQNAKALWEVVLKSPRALEAIHGASNIAAMPEGRERDDAARLREMLERCELRMEAILDPAYGFSWAEACLYSGTVKDAETLGRLLEMSRRDTGQATALASSGWMKGKLRDLSIGDPAGYAKLRNAMTDEERKTMDALAPAPELMPGSGRQQPPGADELRGIGEEALSTLRATWLGRGQPLSLATLLELPEQTRAQAVVNYFDCGGDSRYGTRALAEMGRLDELPLADWEKDELWMNGAKWQWEQEGDGPAALKWLQQVKEDPQRDEAAEKVIAGYAAEDPQGALEYARTSMPQGPLRDLLIEKATAALP